MFAPSACTANIVHDFTACPSSSTVHAPQIEVSQPICVPVRAERVAQIVHEQQTRLDLGRVIDTIDVDTDSLFHSSYLVS